MAAVGSSSTGPIDETTPSADAGVAMCMCDYVPVHRMFDRDPSAWSCWAYTRAKFYGSNLVCVFCQDVGNDPKPDLQLYVKGLAGMAVTVYHQKHITSKRNLWRPKETMFRIRAGNLEVVEGVLTQWDQPTYFFRDYLPVGVYKSPEGWILDLRAKLTYHYHWLQREGERLMRVSLLLHMSECAFFDANVFPIVRGFTTGFTRPKKSIDDVVN